MRNQCKTCKNTKQYCTCETFNANPVSQGDSNLCAWHGCNSLGVISPSTSGGAFYCRMHAKEAMNLDMLPFTPSPTRPGWYR